MALSFPCIWSLSLLDAMFLAGSFFSSSTVNVSFHSLTACKICAAKCVVRWTGTLVCVICFLSLATFRVVSLFLESVTRLGWGDSHCWFSYTWIVASFSRCWTFSAIVSLSVFSVPLEFLNPSWIAALFMLVLISCKISLFLLILIFPPPTVYFKMACFELNAYLS